MIFSWWRRRRRRRIAARPFPETWQRIIQRNVAQYPTLSESERSKLYGDVRVFVSEKSWEGCNGLNLTDEIRVTIAANACLLLLGFDDFCFDRLQTVLVYPDRYVVAEKSLLPGGVVNEGVSLRLGEAWYRGPVILAWSSVRTAEQIPHKGRNVVIHEFAHRLDMLDHSVNGTPPLENATQYDTWRAVMSTEYEQLIHFSEQGRSTLLDPYGTSDEAEFFAVSSECFFEQPIEMADQHPQLYTVLRDFYHQDPARRISRAMSLRRR